MTENQQRIEAAIDNLLFDERRTLQRIDVETLVDAYRRACIERDELKAQLAAVPVGPIRRWYENSNPQLMEYEFIADVETDAEFIEAWLETQVTP